MGVQGELLPDPTVETVVDYARSACVSLVLADRGLACVGIEVQQGESGPVAIMSAMRKNGVPVDRGDDDVLASHLATHEQILNESARRCFSQADWNRLEMTESVSSFALRRRAPKPPQ